MKLQIIGTASAKAELNRFHSSFIISDGKAKILFDAGDGISQALLQSQIDFSTINSIIISHFHADHIAVLPLLITRMKISRRTKPLKIFVPNKLVDSLNRLLNLFYIFPEKTDFEISVLPFYGEGKFTPENEIEIVPMKNSHVVNKYQIPPNKNVAFESYGFLISQNDVRLYYTADISSSDELNLFNDKNPTHIITEAYHVSLDEIFSFAQTTSAIKVFITHYASELIPLFNSKIKKEKSDGKVHLLEDGEKINFLEKDLLK